MQLTDTEFNLVLRYTSAIKLDDSLDLASDEQNDYFYDFENDEKLSLEEGFSIIAEGIAYPFEHEGFNKEEGDTLEALIKKFVPDFTIPVVQGE